MMPDWQAVGMFCEDVRQEIGGTFSIIGIHSDNLNVMHVPGTLAKFGFVVRVYARTSKEIGEVSARIVFADDSEQHLGTFSQAEVETARTSNLAKDLPLIGFVLHAVGVAVPIPKAGLMQLFARVGDEERLCCAINISLKSSSSSASLPPSSRSGTDSQQTNS